MIYVPRVWGGTIILNSAPPVVQVPGLATISDQAHALVAISDALIDQATASDTEVGNAAISDQA